MDGEREREGEGEGEGERERGRGGGRKRKMLCKETVQKLCTLPVAIVGGWQIISESLIGVIKIREKSRNLAKNWKNRIID